MTCRLFAICATLALTLATAAITAANPPAQMAGWEKDSAYNRLYKATELDRIKVVVERAADTGIRKGDELKIRGAWAEVGGKDVFLAAKIKKGEHFNLKVRLTKDGTPFWTMTPEQQAQEKETD